MRVLLAACVLSIAVPASAQIVRVGDLNPIYQKEWIGPAKAHDEALEAKQREWLRRNPR